MVSEPDDGIYHAINKGIGLAQGELIGLIHCGDSYTKNALFHAYNIFKKTNADIIYGDIEINEEHENVDITRISTANHMLLKKQMSIFHPSTFIAKTCYKKYGYYNTGLSIAADYDLFLRYYLLGVTFEYLPKVLVRFSTGGVSETKTWQLVKEVISIKKKHLGMLNVVLFLFNRISSYVFYSSRKIILMKILGEGKFKRLKKMKLKKIK